MCPLRGLIFGSIERLTLLTISFADTQLESPQTELHRITQRGAPDKGDARLGKQPHFPQSGGEMLIGWQSRYESAFAGLERGEWSHEREYARLIRRGNHTGD